MTNVALLVAFAAAKIFDGKTLEGWEGNLELWRAEGGAIVGTSPGTKHNEFLCTREAFADFELKATFKVTGDAGRNSGIQLRSKRLDGSTEVVGYQADIGAGYWGALYDESRRNKVLIGPPKEARDKAARPDGWNSYVIRAVGSRITLTLNGKVTADWTETDDSVAREGSICLQLHSGKPLTVAFKKLSLKKLSASTSPSRP